MSGLPVRCPVRQSRFDPPIGFNPRGRVSVPETVMMPWPPDVVAVGYAHRMTPVIRVVIVAPVIRMRVVSVVIDVQVVRVPVDGKCQSDAPE